MTNTGDIEELRLAVVALAERVTNLSTSLNTVNDIQIRQIKQEKATKALEVEARGAATKATQIESVLIPREEHERRWKKEQEGLIALRLRIRKQTYIIGGIFFGLSLTALGIATSIIYHQQKANNDAQRAVCQTRVDNSKAAVVADDQLLKSPTIAHDGTLKQLIIASREAAVRSSVIKC